MFRLLYHKYVFNIIVVLILLLIVVEDSLGNSEEQRVSVGAYITDEYAKKVLLKVLPFWMPPTDGTGIEEVLLLIGREGELISCEAVLEKKDADVDPDYSVCEAAFQVERFDAPPNRNVTEVFLSLGIQEKAFTARNSNVDYSKYIVNSVTPYIDIPEGIEGKYVVEFDIFVEGNGEVTKVQCRRPSGNSAIDTAVMTALRIPGIIPAPLEKIGEAVKVVFTIGEN